MTGHPSDGQTPHVTVMETPVTPRDDSREAELRAELRAARELLAVREARRGNDRPLTLPPRAVAHPRMLDMGIDSLSSLVKRLERDLDDLDRTTEAFERLAAEDEDRG